LYHGKILVKVLCLTDFPVKPGDRWLWNDLPQANDQVDFLWVKGVIDRFPKWGKLLTYYPTYFWLGIKAIAQTSRRDYDLVVAWEGKNGFPLALYRSFLRIYKPKMVILAYNQRGIISHFPALTRFALKSVDRLVVLSEWDANYLSSILGIPSKKIRVLLLGWYDVGKGQVDIHPPVEDFIFACGRSYRDYATFAKAVAGLPCKVVINARKFNVDGIQFPPNVVVNDLLPRAQFVELMTQSRFVVVPLMDITHSAGESVILQAMAMRKAIIASRAPGPNTYINEGETGLLVKPYDATKLREAISYLWDHPEEADRMGRNARNLYEERHTFAAFAQRVHAVLTEVCCAAS